jgi:acyl-CoA synthetase (AMP-forming)/AMP-acid ligase II
MPGRRLRTYAAVTTSPGGDAHDTALRAGFDVAPGDLIEHCRRSLARYKVPREVYIEETLPKNALGKIAKPVLRTRLEDV